MRLIPLKQIFLLFAIVFIAILAGLIILESQTTQVQSEFGYGFEIKEFPKQAKGFQLYNIDGEIVDIEEMIGEKPLIIDFFATWCPNCQRSMPKLSYLYTKYQDKVNVVGINLHENETLVKNFIESKNIKYPILLDPDRDVQKQYDIVYTNYHLFINTKGEIVATGAGDVTEAQIQFLIEGSK